MAADVLSLEDDAQQGKPLIELVMQGGKRLKPAPTLAELRARAARDCAASRPRLIRSRVSDALRRLAVDVDARMARRQRQTGQT